MLLMKKLVLFITSSTLIIVCLKSCLDNNPKPPEMKLNTFDRYYLWEDNDKSQYLTIYSEENISPKNIFPEFNNLNWVPTENPSSLPSQQPNWYKTYKLVLDTKTISLTENNKSTIYLIGESHIGNSQLQVAEKLTELVNQHEIDAIFLEQADTQNVSWENFRELEKNPYKAISALQKAMIDDANNAELALKRLENNCNRSHQQYSINSCNLARENFDKILKEPFISASDYFYVMLNVQGIKIPHKFIESGSARQNYDKKRQSLDDRQQNLTKEQQSLEEERQNLTKEQQSLEEEIQKLRSDSKSGLYSDREIINQAEQWKQRYKDFESRAKQWKQRYKDFESRVKQWKQRYEKFYNSTKDDMSKPNQSRIREIEMIKRITEQIDNNQYHQVVLIVGDAHFEYLESQLSAKYNVINAYRVDRDRDFDPPMTISKYPDDINRLVESHNGNDFDSKYVSDVPPSKDLISDVQSRIRADQVLSSNEEKIIESFTQQYQDKKLKGDDDWEIIIPIDQYTNVLISSKKNKIFVKKFPLIVFDKSENNEDIVKIRIKDKEAEKDVDELIEKIEKSIKKTHPIKARNFHHDENDWEQMEDGTVELTLRNDYNHQIGEAVYDKIQASQLTTNKSSVTIYEAGTDTYVEILHKGQKTAKIRKIDQKDLAEGIGETIATWFSTPLAQLKDILPFDTSFIKPQLTSDLINAHPEKFFGKFIKKYIPEIDKEAVFMIDSGVIKFDINKAFSPTSVYRVASNMKTAEENVIKYDILLNSQITKSAKNITVFDGIPQDEIDFKKLKEKAQENWVWDNKDNKEKDKEEDKEEDWKDSSTSLKSFREENEEFFKQTESNILEDSYKPKEDTTLQEQLKKDLETKKVVILIGHNSNKNEKLYLFDKNRNVIELSKEDIKNLYSEKLKKNAPIVFLISCNAGGAKSPFFNPESLTQQFLKIGVSSVIASEKQINPKYGVNFLKTFFNEINQSTFESALQKSIESTNQEIKKIIEDKLGRYNETQNNINKEINREQIKIYNYVKNNNSKEQKDA